MSAKATELVAFTVRLSEDEHKSLSDLAEREHRSLGAEARKAIVEHLARVTAEAAA